MRAEKSSTGFYVGSEHRRFYLDRVLMVSAVALVLLGYVMVVSASLHLGERVMQDILYYPRQQMVHIVLGCLAAGTVLMMPLDLWEKTSCWLFLAGLILLVLVFLPGLGVEVNGSVRWLSVGGIRVQVSELVKLFSVVYMAGYITRHEHIVRDSVYGMIRPLVLLSFACILLLLEPDFGAAVVIMATALGMMFLCGARVWQFLLLLASVTILGVTLIRTSPYRMARFTGFMDPWADPLDSGFQLIQALIAFGSGEWLGVGLGGSVQKLFYLPEGHTDFLFSVIGEELGLIGVSTVIVLFSVLIWRAFAIGRNAEIAGLSYAAFLAYGLGIWFGIQAFINMGVNMGMLPTKGLTLPFMSYGGGSMIVMFCGLGLLMRVHNDTAGVWDRALKRKPAWLNAS